MRSRRSRAVAVPHPPRPRSALRSGRPRQPRGRSAPSRPRRAPPASARPPAGRPRARRRQAARGERLRLRVGKRRESRLSPRPGCLARRGGPAGDGGASTSSRRSPEQRSQSCPGLRPDADVHHQVDARQRIAFADPPQQRLGRGRVFVGSRPTRLYIVRTAAISSAGLSMRGFCGSQWTVETRIAFDDGRAIQPQHAGTDDRRRDQARAWAAWTFVPIGRTRHRAR